MQPSNPNRPTSIKNVVLQASSLSFKEDNLVLEASPQNGKFCILYDIELSNKSLHDHIIVYTGRGY